MPARRLERVRGDVPADLRCASLGQVTVVSRSLDAVKLSVDMACTTPSRAAETSAAP